MYANGEGVAQDAAAAVKWYRKAAEQGHAAVRAAAAAFAARGWDWECVVCDNNSTVQMRCSRMFSNVRKFRFSVNVHAVNAFRQKNTHWMCANVFFCSQSRNDVFRFLE